MIMPTHPNSQRVVDRIKDSILAAGARELKDATTIVPEAYFDQGYWEWEVENILKKQWICVAHESQIQKPGDYVNMDVLGEPMIVVRGKDNEINILSRVCSHRGMDIMPKDYGYDEQGNVRIFMCPYHSWTFDLDGQLRGCPEMQKTESFCRDNHPLQSYRTEVWEGFVFVSFNPDAPSVAEQYAGLGEFVSPWKMKDMDVVIELEWDLDFNWKTMIENWMEPYHHMGIHIKTLQPMMPARHCWTEDYDPDYTAAHLPYRGSVTEKIEAAEAAGEKPDGFVPVPDVPESLLREWTVFVGYPCFMVLTAPDRALWYRLLPQGPEKCKLVTTTLVTKEAQAHPDYAEDLELETKGLRDFHMEDMQVCESVQRGLHSSAFRQGRLSYLEKPVWCIHKYLASMIRKADAADVPDVPDVPVEA